MTTAARPRSASALGVLLPMIAIALLPTAPASAGPPRTATVVGAASPAAAKGCFVVTNQNVRYCSATIDQIKQNRYPAGQRVVLKGVSVTNVSSTSITISVGWPVFKPCPPGMWCGAGTSTWYQTDLAVPWTGSGRPASPSVIDLCGTVSAGPAAPTVRPGPWTLRPGECYVDWAAMGLC